MTATFGVATPGSRPELISAMYRRLQWIGFDAAEAANLTAVKHGIGIVAQPWTVRELTHLLFLQSLCRAGRRWSGVRDRVDDRDRTPASAMVGRATAPGPEDRSSVTGTASTRGVDASPSDGRVTLLTVFRAIAGPNAAPEFLRLAGAPGPDVAGDVDGERR